MKGYRTLDWRFFVALAAMLMVAYLVVGGYQDNVRKGQRIDTLIAQAQAADGRAAANEAAAAKERQRLLENQDRLLRLYLAQVERQQRLGRNQAALVAFLKREGIDIPTRFLIVQNPPAGPGISPRKSSSIPDKIKGPKNDHGKGPKKWSLDDLLKGNLHGNRQRN